jgi:hypothetical protein
MLACDDTVDFVAKLATAYLFDGRRTPPVINKNNGKVDLVVCCGPVVVVIPDVEDEDGQTVPFVDGHELGVARSWVDAEGAACFGKHLVVLDVINGRFLAEKHGNAHRGWFMEHLGNMLRQVSEPWRTSGTE